MENQKQIIINIDGVEYQTFSTPVYDKTNKWTMPDDRNIAAIIPGTIVEIFVKIGDTVVGGDAMLVIEAMKMNNQIKFVRDGIVEEILVKQGDIVSKGQILIKLK